MLGARHTSRVVWRRRHASRHYAGYVLVTDDAVRLAGNEQDTGIHSVLSIPPTAIEGARVGQAPDEQIVGEQAVVIELADDDPIYLRPVTTGALGLVELARKLSSVSDYRRATLSMSKERNRGQREPEREDQDTRVAATYLTENMGPIVESAEAALAARAPHYAEIGPAVLQARIETLYKHAIQALERNDLTPLTEHARQIAAERFHSGYDLSEVQTAINACEETIWLRAFADLGPASYSAVLPSVSAAFGAAKDALAREYVALAATTQAPALDLEALARG